MKQAVINSSPLILLFETELEFILKEIFSEIIVPETVWKEVCESGGLAKLNVASEWAQHKAGY